MKLDIISLFQENNISYQTEGHKHCQPGWVNLECPFCTGDVGLHLGFNIDNGFFNCWRCGAKFPDEVIAKLLHITKKEANVIIRKYQTGRVIIPETKAIIRRKSFKFPSNTAKMLSNHRKYLTGRGFDPEQLEDEWGLLGTGPIARLDGIDYKHRVIVPIYWNSKVVSFQGRDISDKHSLKYMACTKERELIHHKDILYGNQKHWTDTGICVEGVTDVWRFGKQSFATLGIKFTSKQLRLIATNFKRVAVVFDGGESQSVKQANKLVKELKFRGVDSWRVDIEGDPASMKQEDADYLIKQLIT